MIDTDATVREAAKKFGVGRNTIYLDITERLKEINPLMQAEISLILKSHKSEMNIRGGISTKK
ncbi:stage III sporulation protein D [Clostridium neonatale]|uniref:Stage III sporulation protein D n=1 Tax=Clostridium neonatale TaxID=137838 RepID=A0A2A7MKP1_9CLOT|nr:stage III sporulation protein D [Clostridium neonatale]PEG32063.1 stage III sporulation protein D [Clostridium neonatale]